MNFCNTFILTVRNLAEVFGAKTTHFDVIVIRKKSFQALTKNFLKISKIAKVCAQWRMSLSPPPRSLLDTDRSKAVVLV